MQLRQLRLVAVLAVVVLALTGFSSGKSKSKSHSKGGGCSSSHSSSSSSNSSSSSSGSTAGSGSSSDPSYGSSYSPRPTTAYRRSTSSPTSSGSASSTTQPNAIDQVTVLRCLSSGSDASRPTSQLRIDNSRGTKSYYFTAVVRLNNIQGEQVGTSKLSRTLVKARSTKTVQVTGTLDAAIQVGEWTDCVVASADRRVG
ncbi:hypothetical protein [Streptomyces sp. H39-S7]|uniref:hypothetical protein n=1 Tax=Streptomyces sp. H39-S7 TaxID=3004357 RepID=UPI0022B06C4E|nr:hypothetical protein [Streptomyces sp. H39-S7]MCZ4118543.1 hypothetical protein [Streptomyces sp. H39-S7]